MRYIPLIKRLQSVCSTWECIGDQKVGTDKRSVKYRPPAIWSTGWTKWKETGKECLVRIDRYQGGVTALDFISKHIFSV